jgi:heme exporter protein B
MGKLLSESWAMLRWDLKREWKEKNAIGSMLVFLLSTLMVVYFALGTRLRPELWTALFWIVLLFGTSGVVLRSFSSESKAKMLSIYSLVHPNVFILGRILHNAFNTLVLALLCIVFFLLFYGIQIEKPMLFAGSAILGSLCMSTLLTFITSLAHRVKNPHILSVILAFPISIPILLSSIKMSLAATSVFVGISVANLSLILLALLVLVLSLSLLLFPYLWRE